EENLVKMLKLKRAETPGKEYFNHFLPEFHRYQRSLMVERPSLWKKFITECSELFTPQQALAGSFACALILMAASLFYTGHQFAQSNQLLAQNPLIQQEVQPAAPDAFAYANRQAQQAEIIPASLNRFDQDFKDSRYVTGPVAINYETQIAF
ncbi:MAG: hypothetical protein AAF984_02975, partial [Verrucomicrobiota bacterium]